MSSPLSLYQFETAHRVAMLARLRALGLTAEQVFDELAVTAALPPARIVVGAAGFARASTQKGINRQGAFFDNHFGGQITYEITTPRTSEGVAIHEYWLGLIRELTAAPMQPFAGLPYQVIKLLPAAGTLTQIRDGERDRSELPYDLELCIPGPAMDHAAARPPQPPVPPPV